jgi:hypothetical protein
MNLPYSYLILILPYYMVAEIPMVKTYYRVAETTKSMCKTELHDQRKA